LGVFSPAERNAHAMYAVVLKSPQDPSEFWHLRRYFTMRARNAASTGKTRAMSLNSIRPYADRSGRAGARPQSENPPGSAATS